MLELYSQLFAGLHSQDIDYAVWKNVQELPEALMGKGDIDLYIPLESRRSFIACLQGYGFTKVISHKSFPCVEHYYGYDAKAGKFCHLHCYFRIVTGESHIKQFVVPVEQHTSGLPNLRNALGVNEMHPLLQMKLNIFRRKIKLSCLPGAILFFIERQGYEQEQRLLTQSIETVSADNLQQGKLDWLHTITESSTILDEVLAGLMYRYRFRHWNRFGAFATPFHRYKAILLRVLGKLQHRRKTFPIGFTISIIGSSDNEAALLEKQLRSWLGSHFNVIASRYDDKCDTARFLNGADVDRSSTALLLRVMWNGLTRKCRVWRATRQVLGGSVVICRNANNGSMLQILRKTLTRNSERTLQSLFKQRIFRICEILYKSELPIDIVLSSQYLKEDTDNENGGNIKRTVASAKSCCPPVILLKPTCKETLDIDSQLYNNVLDTEGGRRCSISWKNDLWQAVLVLQRV